ncbi:YjbH domain-containing protein [Paracoccaceae bacterium Fryx2]|nr:YjbH domain-containing protein [Paracoccaceae bacterium Fryx2]
MSRIFRLSSGRIPAATAAVALLVASAAAAETTPTANLLGTAGLIDMPSGESMTDGEVTATVSSFAGINRMTLSFQITPRLSGSFRYSGVKDLNYAGFVDYYDRSFDLRYRLLDEGQWLPSVSVGLQDFVGTGIYAGEYLAATKTFGPNLKVTAGLGWGRLGSYGDIGSPFGGRPKPDFGGGGKPNFDQWFRGRAAPFAGIEWQATDRLGFKVEYSSDDYTLESGTRAVFDRQSPFNFGVEYQASKRLRLGAYALYGSELGLSASFSARPNEAMTPYRYPAPNPVAPRPSRAAAPEAWSNDWVTQADAPQILTRNMERQLALDGLVVESLTVSETTAELRFRDKQFDVRPNAIGRAARALATKMPATIETFRLVPVVDGQPTVAVTVRRSDLERLETAPDATAAMWAATRVEDAGGLPAVPPAEGLYPKFIWSIGPYARTSYFDPKQPLRYEVGLRARGSLEIQPGLVLAGSIRKPGFGDIDDRVPGRGACNPARDAHPPNVRTDYACYDREGDPGIEHLTLTRFFRPGENLYARATVGYLEPMYAGVSGELLWKPVDSRLALGVEVNYVRSRDYDMMFGLLDYGVATGHASAYYDMGRGYTAQVDVGRYLAGDWGSTVSLDRRFDNGWRVGAFATLTDMSFDDFGEGSFDKGIRVTVPLTWLTGQPSQTTYNTTLRPVTRDGGARVDVRDRLFDRVRGQDAHTYEAQWGRFWR